MNRLQKKCFIASTGVHLLLVLLLFVGSGFFSGSKSNETTPELQFLAIPDFLTVNGPSGGGNPKAAPPTPKPSLSAPPVTQSKSEPVKELDSPKESDPKIEKTAKTDPNSYETKKKLTAQDLKPVRKSSNNSNKVTKKSSSDDQEQKLAAAREQTSKLLRQMAGSLSGSSAVKVDDSPGPRGGGPTYTSYASWVQMVYWDAWVAPDDSSTESAVVRARVTISSDGSVIASEIISGSGDSTVDASVQRTLNRVTTMHKPFPEGMKEKQKTYNLNFDLKAKKGLA